jgi:hypothetical protein
MMPSASKCNFAGVFCIFLIFLENGFVDFGRFVQNLHNSAPLCATSQRKSRPGVEQIR